MKTNATFITIWLVFKEPSVAAGSTTSMLSKNEEKEPSRVAFILAGAARSFIEPMVSESLRSNLVFSFCPPSSCVADIFARLSKDDNKHEGISSLGVFNSGNDSLVAAAHRALERFLLHFDTPNARQGRFSADSNASRSRDDMTTRRRMKRENNRKSDSYTVGGGRRQVLSVNAISALGGNDGPKIGGSLVFENVDIGSSVERKEMLDVEEGYKRVSPILAKKHKVFRELDPRRYSMYFNRW
jgi:hypothetical protein